MMVRVRCGLCKDVGCESCQGGLWEDRDRVQHSWGYDPVTEDFVCRLHGTRINREDAIVKYTQMFPLTKLNELCNTEDACDSCGLEGGHRGWCKYA
jgi:hypothetical protein